MIKCFGFDLVFEKQVVLLLLDLFFKWLFWNPIA